MKVMKNRMCHGLMLSFLLLASVGYAHTESETNAVAKSMLEFVLLSVNDNLDDVDDGAEVCHRQKRRLRLHGIFRC